MIPVLFEIFFYAGFIQNTVTKVDFYYYDKCILNFCLIRASRQRPVEVCVIKISCEQAKIILGKALQYTNTRTLHKLDYKKTVKSRQALKSNRVPLMKLWSAILVKRTRLVLRFPLFA